MERPVDVQSEEEKVMCVACGQELCKQCKECHNSECERYIEPTEECETDNTQELVEHPLVDM